MFDSFLTSTSVPSAPNTVGTQGSQGTFLRKKGSLNHQHCFGAPSLLPQWGKRTHFHLGYHQEGLGKKKS